MNLMEKFDDEKFIEIKNGSVITGKYTEVEIEFFSLLLLITYQNEYSENDNFLDAINNNFNQYSKRKTKNILKKCRGFFLNKYNRKIFSSYSQETDYNELIFNMEDIKYIYEIENEINEIYSINVLLPSACHVPIGTITNYELIKNSVDYNNLKAAFNEEISLKKPFLYEYYDNHIKDENNGLYFNVAPTGSGKSHNFANFISINWLYYLIFNERDMPNIFYMTNLKNNTIPVYKKTYELIHRFCLKHQIRDQVKSFLLSKIALILSEQDLILHFKQQINNSIFLKIFEEVCKRKGETTFFRQIILEVESTEISKSNKYQINQLYRKISDFFRNNVKSLSEKEKKIMGFIFNGEEAKDKSNNSINIYFMTTNKAEKGLKTFTKKYNLFEEKDNIVFIDESDKQYQVLLDSKLNNNSEFDLYAINRTIISIKDRKFKIDEKHSFEKIENLRLDFVKNKIMPLYNDFCYDHSYEIINKNNTLTIFEDNINHLLVNNKQFVNLELDKKSQMNRLHIYHDESKTPMNKKGNNFPDLILQSQKFLNDFVFFVKKCINYYHPQITQNKDFTFTEKVKFLLEELNLPTDFLLEYILDFDNEKVESNQFSFVDNVIKIVKISENMENAVFKQKTFLNNPNKILLRLAQNNKVFLISATADHDSVITNFNLKYLKKALKSNYKEFNKKEKIDLYNELKNQYSNIEKNCNINVKIPNSIISKSIIQQIMLENNKKDYQIDRLAEYSNVIYDFLINPTSKFLLLLCPELIKSFESQKIEKLFLEQYKLKDFKIFPNENCEKVDSDFFRGMGINEMYDFLNTKKQNKIVLITSYETVGAGVNIQPNNITGIDLDNYININNHLNNGYDIDSLYLAMPTQLITNVMKKNEYSIEENIKQIIALQSLLDRNLMSPIIYKKITRNIVDSGSNINSSIDSIHKNTIDFKNAAFAKMKQGIGRITRTNLRNKNINIYVSLSILKYQFNNLKYQVFDTPEFKKFIDFINNNKITEKMKILDEKIIDNRNQNCALKFYSMKYKILSKAYNDKDETHIKKWEDLRTFCLKKGVFINDKDLDDLEIDDSKSIFLYYDYPVKSYSYTKEEDIYIYENKKNNIIINEKFFHLDIISLNESLKNYFYKKDYKLSFNYGNYAMPPNMCNDIYKGALGEAIGEWLFEEKLNISIIKDKNIKKDLFEIADFFIKSSNGIIGIDMKNYNLILNNNEHNYKLLNKIENKLEGDYLKKIIIINTFLGEMKSEIKYGFVNNGYFEEIKDTKNTNVCIINGILDKNGNLLIDYAYYLEKLMEWII